MSILPDRVRKSEILDGLRRRFGQGIPQHLSVIKRSYPDRAKDPLRRSKRDSSSDSSAYGFRGKKIDHCLWENSRDEGRQFALSGPFEKNQIWSLSSARRSQVRPKREI